MDTVEGLELRARRALDWLNRLPLSLWQQLVIALLVIALCLVLTQLFWLIVSPGFVPGDTKVQSVPVNARLVERASATKTHVDIGKLKSLELFGEGAAETEVAPVVAVAPPSIEQDAVDTRLNLRLNGVIGSNDQKAARAIIAEGNKQALFAPGDILPAGRDVRLVKVLADRVILDNGGRYEALWLYTDEPIQAAPPPRRTTRTSPRREAASRSVDRSSLRAASLDSVIKFSMARKGGQVIGFKVRPGSNRAMFNKIGLKPNDIVTAVDGMELNSSAKAMEIYQKMRGATTASLDILRNNEPLSLTVSVDEG